MNISEKIDVHWYSRRKSEKQLWYYYQYALFYMNMWAKSNNELSHMVGVLSNICLSNLTHHSNSKFPFHNKICQSNLTYCSNFKVPILGEICQSNLTHNYNFKVPVLIKIYQSNLILFPTTRYYTSISYVNSTFHIVLNSRQSGFALKWFMIGRQESEYQEVFVCLSGD